MWSDYFALRTGRLSGLLRNYCIPPASIDEIPLFILQGKYFSKVKKKTLLEERFQSINVSSRTFDKEASLSTYQQPRSIPLAAVTFVALVRRTRLEALCDGTYSGIVGCGFDAMKMKKLSRDAK